MYQKLLYYSIIMSIYNISIASDHAGFSLKEKIIRYLNSIDCDVTDLGPKGNNESVDYPDYAITLCKYLLENPGNIGILICATGIGMSIAANRFSDIRAALCTSVEMAELARMHNDANILVLGSKINSVDTNISIVKKFLSTSFEGGRHILRLAKIT